MHCWSYFPAFSKDVQKSETRSLLEKLSNLNKSLNFEFTRSLFQIKDVWALSVSISWSDEKGELSSTSNDGGQWWENLVTWNN